MLILGFSACDVVELDLQDDPNAVSPDNAGVDFLYNNLMLSFAGFYNGTHNFTGRTVRQTAMTNGNTYNNAYQAVSFNGLWYNAYAGIFPDVDALLNLTDERGLTIHSGSAKVMKAYVMLTLVDVFGDVPYSEALQGTDIISPKADDGASIYTEAIRMLDEAITDLDGSVAAAPANDLIYGGSTTSWIAAANSLKMKAYLNTKDAGGFMSVLNDDNYITAAGDDFQFNYGSSRSNPNSRHPWYNNAYEASDAAYQSNYMMWLMDGEKSMEDPRLRFYFYRQENDMEGVDPNAWSCILTETPFDPVTTGWGSIITEPHWAASDPEWELPYCIASNDGYAGRDHGNGSGIPPDGGIRAVYGLYPAGGNFDDNSYDFTQNEGVDGALGEGINPIMLSSFVDFMRAEAALTLNTGEDARALLESAVRASITKVRTMESFVDAGKVIAETPVVITLGEAFLDDLDSLTNEYVNIVLARYDSAGGVDDQLNTVITEYFIALYGNGVEAYNAYRRTGFPKGIQPGIEPGIGTFPNSALYPADYVNLNANATQKADLSVKVFWAEGFSPSLY